MDQTPREAPNFQDGLIDQFLRRRVCARCFGDLSERAATPHYHEVYCPTCGDAWGYTTVSRKYAERLGEKAIFEMYEVRQNLADLFPREKRTEKQTLDELGF